MLTSEDPGDVVLSLDACDPKRLIRDALGGGPLAGWSARELYLAWLLSVPVEIDAAHAAALLLSRTAALPTDADDVALDLMALLRRTTAYPRERLEPAAFAPKNLH